MPGSVWSEDWEEVQKITFTRWANTYLSRKRMMIDDLYEDLSDGIRLISLLQIICREKVCKKFIKKPRMRIQKLENLNFAFDFLRRKNINLTNIGTSDILDGNQKLILGLMWTLIKSFQVAEIDVEGVSGKDGLLLWVNRSLSEYPNVEVKNFSGSWSDGMAFCALIHRFYPSAIEFAKLSPANAAYNVKLAFDTAQERFRIPQLLNVSDVAGKPKPDEKSIMTYVSLLFKEFASGQQKKKAVTTLSKAINIAQRHQDLANEYAQNASGLLEWLTQQADRFQTMSQPRSITNIREALSQHMEYKKNEKPPHEALYVAVEGCAGRWISSCKNNSRPIPELNPPVEKLQEMKEKLDKLEIDFETHLRETLESFQKTEVFLSKIVKDLEKVEQWAKEKQTSVLFQGGLLASTTAEAEEKLENVNFIEEVELPRYKQLLATVVDNSHGLSADNTAAASAVERVEKMSTFVATVEGKIGDVKERLNEALRKQKEVDAVVKDCKMLMRNLKYVLEEMDEEVESSTRLQVATKETVLAAQAHFEDVLIPKLHQSLVDEIAKLVAKKEILANAGRTNEVSQIDGMNTRVQKLLATCDEKREYFKEELTNVEKRDEVCREFADLSGKIKERCAKSTHTINNTEGSLAEQYSSMVTLRTKLFRQSSGIDDQAPLSSRSMTLQDLLAEVEEERKRLAEEKEENGEAPPPPETELVSLTQDMDELEKVNEELERLRVFTNPYTSETIQSLRAQLSSLENAVRDKVKSLEKEIALSKLGNLTPDQLKEIKEVFDHFDLDNDGVLARDEFIMACKGLGLTLSEDDCHDYFDKIDVDDNDEIDFNAFSDFCAEQLQSGSSKEDVVTAFDVLTSENLTMEKIEEQFDPMVVEFIKNNKDQVMMSDGETIDSDKFAAFIFSL